MRANLRTALLGFGCLAIGGLANAQFSFQRTDLTVGAQPDATAVGDLDGDGDLDLATTTDAPDKVSLLSNNGGGTFGAPVRVLLGAGTSPHGIVIGDLDGDGDNDIAVTLKNVNLVQLVVNTAGTFAPGATFAVGGEPRALRLGDLDGDGDLDLVSSNLTGNSLSVLRNGGGLSFTVASYAAGVEPRELDLGDVTGDGLLDLAVAAHDSRQVLVLRNAGGAAFVPHATLGTAGQKPEGVVIARLDANATLDVAATYDNNGVEFAIVFLNAGGGAFGAGASYLQPGQNGGSIVAADFDLDGDRDLAIANQDSSDVAVLPNAGNGTFGAAQLFAVGSQPTHVTTGDLDGNGGTDLVTSNDSASSITVLRNGNGSLCSTAAYCSGKVNSQGGVAQMGSSGAPSVSAQNFAVTASSALPNQNGLMFFGTNGPQAVPLLGGTLCLLPPLVRMGIQNTGAGGNVSYPVAVAPAMVGTTRWYQFFYRDPSHPDGTGAGLSNALAVRFCN